MQEEEPPAWVRLLPYLTPERDYAAPWRSDLMRRDEVSVCESAERRLDGLRALPAGPCRDQAISDLEAFLGEHPPPRPQWR